MVKLKYKGDPVINLFSPIEKYGVKKGDVIEMDEEGAKQFNNDEWEIVKSLDDKPKGKVKK